MKHLVQVPYGISNLSVWLKENKIPEDKYLFYHYRCGYYTLYLKGYDCYVIVLFDNISSMISKLKRDLYLKIFTELNNSSEDDLFVIIKESRFRKFELYDILCLRKFSYEFIKSCLELQRNRYYILFEPLVRDNYNFTSEVIEKLLDDGLFSLEQVMEGFCAINNPSENLKAMHKLMSL